MRLPLSRLDQDASADENWTYLGGSIRDPGSKSRARDLVHTWSTFDREIEGMSTKQRQTKS